MNFIVFCSYKVVQLVTHFNMPNFTMQSKSWMFCPYKTNEIVTCTYNMFNLGLWFKFHCVLLRQSATSFTLTTHVNYNSSSHLYKHWGIWRTKIEIYFLYIKWLYSAPRNEEKCIEKKKGMKRRHCKDTSQDYELEQINKKPPNHFF
jgi:hypothetical protein